LTTFCPNFAAPQSLPTTTAPSFNQAPVPGQVPVLPEALPQKSSNNSLDSKSSILPPGELQRQYDEAFLEMLRLPANLDVLFKFAGLAVQSGDIEGAISALERMLLLNPNLPRVRLELGALYFRLRSYQIARTYIEGVLKIPDLPTAVRERAQGLIAQIADHETPSHFYGEVFMGWRYQANANLGPPSQNILLFGAPSQLSQSAVGTPDWGFVSSLQLRHSYDLGQQDKASLETQFSAYVNRQFQVNSANVNVFDLNTGPRFQVFAELFKDITVKPIVVAGIIQVNDVTYYKSLGSGIELSSFLSDRWRNTSNFSWRTHRNENNWYLPTNQQYTGAEYNVQSSFGFTFSNTVSFYGSGALQRYATEATPTQNYMQISISGGMTVNFPAPAGKEGPPWSINLGVTEQWWDYDVIDSTVDPSMSRHQADTILNGVLSIPLDNRTTFSVTGNRYVRTAAIPNYVFENNSVMFGIGWRF